MAGTVEPLGINEKLAVARGNKGPLRVDGTGATVMVGGGLGDYGEAALKSALFHGVADTQTIAAGNVNAASAAATTNSGVLNPSTSSAYVVMLRVTAALQSGTPGVGSIYHSVSRGTTILTSVAGFTRGVSANGGATAQGWVLDSNAGVALTGSVALTTLSCWGAPLTATAITTSATSPLTLVDELKGSIVLAPGDMYLPTFTATGTSLVANFGYLWYEVPTGTI